MWLPSLTVLASLLVSLTPSITAYSLRHELPNPLSPRTAIPSDILSKLTPHLSPTAKVLLPSSPLWANASHRWNEVSRPTYSAIIQSHGVYYPLERFRDGIAISLSSLSRKIELDSSGKWATIGGGMRSKEVIDYLWERGKQTTTGGCGCKHNDLFWAMRGAGHNFGIVSEMKFKVYDVKQPRWSVETFTFKSERLEEVYKYAGEKFNNKGDARLLMWGTWLWNKAVDAEKPVIQFQWIYNGPLGELKELSKDTCALKADAYASLESDYPELSPNLGYGADQYACQADGQGNRLLRGIDVDQYDVKALRKWYDAFTATIIAEPAFETSFCILEGYSTQAVQAVPDKSTAYGIGVGCRSKARYISACGVPAQAGKAGSDTYIVFHGLNSQEGKADNYRAAKNIHLGRAQATQQTALNSAATTPSVQPAPVITAAPSKPALTPEQIRAKAYDLRNKIGRGIRASMKWQRSCVLVRSRYSFSTGVACEEVILRAFRLGPGKKWKMKKIRYSDFYSCVGYIEKPIRYGSLVLTGQHVNVRWNEEEHTITVSGTYGKYSEPVE
ncbi:hypothetical protein B0T21DRAFT_440886 [Apiosordaria backusii]|uniref:Uncharacterized protein n=1 Tax=Apiosordaria backusii TaxID=314023 RepID=A0AA40BLS8_9PEZI|nr:hypothetical protein B0T21DRAFT_440886 [Apiosordaria backusii]